MVSLLYRFDLSLNNDLIIYWSRYTLPDPNFQEAGGVFRSAIDSLCRFIFVEKLSVIPEEERIQVFSEFEQDLSDTITVFGEAGFSRSVISAVTSTSAVLVSCLLALAEDKERCTHEIARCLHRWP